MHDFPPENLRNPARNRRAGLMRQFRSGQLDSTIVDLGELDLGEFGVSGLEDRIHPGVIIAEP